MQERTKFNLTNFVMTITAGLIFACFVASCVKHTPNDVPVEGNAIQGNILGTATNVRADYRTPKDTNSVANHVVNEEIPPLDVLERLNAAVGGTVNAITNKESAPVSEASAADNSGLIADYELALPADRKEFISPCAQLAQGESNSVDTATDKNGKSGAFDALDGKTFAGQIGKKGTIKSDKDKFIFDKGQFHSSICQSYGVGGASYEAVDSAGEISFTAETHGLAGNGSVQWKGIIRKDRLEGTATVLKEGQVADEYWFIGRLQ